MKKLLSMNPSELSEVALEAGLPRFAAGQICSWLYSKRASTIDAMTNISKSGRETLKSICEVGITPYSEVFVSADGTKKYIFDMDGSAVEAVMIPDGDRATLCVSSQKGCAMGCRFCMTGRGGFHGNLDAAQILSQFFAIDEAPILTNAVFMGMGEPLANYTQVMKVMEVLTSEWGLGWSPKRITLSTIGVIPRLRDYLAQSRCHLAVSLHNPFHDERLSVMPREESWPIAQIVDILRSQDFSGQRRVSFEYTMFAGFNDSKRHADALARLLRGIECRINLIRFHEIPDFPYKCSPAPVMEAFRDRLNAAGITTTIRASRGEDILAACGLLAGKYNNASENSME